MKKLLAVLFLVLVAASACSAAPSLIVNKEKAAEKSSAKA